MKKALTSTEKQKIVCESCFAHGVHRTEKQCQDRWEYLQPDYKQIRDSDSY